MPEQTYKPSSDCYRSITAIHTNKVGLKAPAEPSHSLFFNIILCGDFSKNKFYLKSSLRLKAISGTFIIIVKSYNLGLITIS